MQTEQAGAESRKYSTIQPMTPEWFWQGMIPFNEVTVIAGDGGIGKGFLDALLVGVTTNGVDMPDGTPGVPKGSVIMVTSEDDPSMAMSWRLQAVGADMDKVYDMTDEFVIPDTLPKLREEIERIGDVRLVIIDPLSDVSAIPLTSSNVRVRRLVMNPLRRLARETGVAMIVIHHTVKSGRIGGTKGITDAARQVLRVARSVVDDRIRVITVEKTNIASDQAADRAYTITGEFPNVRAHFLTHVPEAPGAQDKEPTVADKIMEVLAEHYKAGETTMDAQTLAKEAKVDYQAARTALTRLKQAGKVINPGPRKWGLDPARFEPLPTVPDKIAS